MKSGHLEETLRRILAEAISTQLDDPRVGFVTVSEVRLNRDNTVAQVFYTVLGDDDDHRLTQKGLRKATGYLRQIIGEQTRLRTIPELRFRYDTSLDRSFELESVFDEIASDESERDPAAESSTDESSPE